MTLQLDPRHEFVWRSPTSIQLGVDRPVVVLTEVTSAQERLLSALVVGVSEPGFDLVARAVDADVATARDLLRAVAPALRDSGTPPLSPPPDTRVRLSGRGPTADAIARLLGEAGLEVRVHDAVDEPRSADVAVIVDHFVIDPSARGFWLRRDIPHLPVVIGDSAVRIGPFIDPGHGPCLWCLDRTRADADPAWPAIASQLLGRRSRADRGLVAAESAALAARLVIDRVAARSASEAHHRTPVRESVSIALEVATGATSIETWVRHHECGCAALPESESRAVSPIGQQKLRTTTARATSSHG